MNDRFITVDGETDWYQVFLEEAFLLMSDMEKHHLTAMEMWTIFTVVAEEIEPMRSINHRKP